MASIDELDSEIGNIRTRIASLHAQRASLASVLLSTPHLSTRLQQRPATNASKIVKKQTNHNQENIYRACAGITAYKVRDPDPNAVDNGNILGVRVEVFVESKFVETYHVLLSRPSTRHKSMLRVHHHTVPACIPIKQLANKHLPQSQRDASKTTEQDLIKFGRALRKELVAWHLRTAAVEKMRREAGIGAQGKRRRAMAQEPTYGKVLNAFVSEDEEDEEEEEDEDLQRRERHVRIIDIESDLAVRQVSVAWSNGRTAAMEVAKDGQITSCVVKTVDGSRLPDLGRKATGRIEGVLERWSA
jgi:central kinetochore subunit Mal2/MCM21